MNQTSYAKVLDHVLWLYEKYSKESRATTQPFHVEKVKDRIKGYAYQPDDILVRESLIEHSGSLPIIATALHPYIEDVTVDLGRALVMLAIHDIGELIVGDEIIFTKKRDTAEAEKQAALSLLHPSFHDFYLEIEELQSNTGRFAKAIDKITPDILDLLTPAEMTIARYKQFTQKNPEEIIPLIKEFKHPYMLWNDFLTRFHLEILDRTDRKLRPFYKK